MTLTAPLCDTPHKEIDKGNVEYLAVRCYILLTIDRHNFKFNSWSWVNTSGSTYE